MIERHIVLTLTVGADDLRELVRSIGQFALEIDMGHIIPGNGASGGWGAGYTWEMRINDGVTHDSYFDAVNRMLTDQDRE